MRVWKKSVVVGIQTRDDFPCAPGFVLGVESSLPYKVQFSVNTQHARK